jgi:hypothetical protein
LDDSTTFSNYRPCNSPHHGEDESLQHLRWHQYFFL